MGEGRKGDRKNSMSLPPAIRPLRLLLLLVSPSPRVPPLRVTESALCPFELPHRTSSRTVSNWRAIRAQSNLLAWAAAALSKLAR